MNREIKFRAWDNVANKYVNDVWKINLIGGVTIDGVWATKDIITEQYTGLKDKNGVEIYEGDIVSADFWIDERIGVVKYGLATYDSGYYQTQGWYIDWISDEDNDHSSGYLFDDTCEVIGNIHETPELLNN